jgi:hypothetical protein
MTAYLPGSLILALLESVHATPTQCVVRMFPREVTVKRTVVRIDFETTLPDP